MTSALAAVAITPQEIIDNRIYIIRDQRVMLDRDLAERFWMPRTTDLRPVRSVT